MSGSSPTRRGVLFGLAAAVSFGISAPLAKRLLDHVSPEMLAGLLYVGAFAFIIGSFSMLADLIFRSFAAAGVTELIISVMTIRKGVIPPTINYETPDPACDLDYVPNVARHAHVEIVISNSFGLGGQNACLVLARYKGK